MKSYDYYETEAYANRFNPNYHQGKKYLPCLQHDDELNALDAKARVTGNYSQYPMSAGERAKLKKQEKKAA